MRGPWSGFERAVLETCEPDVAGWIVHPAETATALAYLVAALLIWTTSRPEDRQLPIGRFPAVIVVVGLASMLFHASFAATLQRVDLAAIFLVTGYLLAATLVSGGFVGRWAFPRSVLAFAGVCSLLPFLRLWLGFAGVAVQSVAVLMLLRRRPAGSAASSDYRVAVTLILPGVALLVLDHAGMACQGGGLAHIFQPHAVWHLLSAAALFFIYRAQREFERVRVTMP